MDINQKTRQQLRLQGIIFVVLFLVIIGLLAWLSKRYQFEADWTASNRNTLSSATIKLLETIPGPVTITAFVREGNLASNREYIRELIARYQKHKADIELVFINPDLEPEKSRQLGITSYGEVIVEYQGRDEHIAVLKEQNLTNTLQRLLRRGEKSILFIGGHGERKADGQANHDWGEFSKTLADKGIRTETIVLNDTPRIPDNIAALVIASPQTNYLPGEVKLLSDYLQRGGNLLWLLEPGESLHGLEPLAKIFGISFHPGTIVDPTTQMLGLNNPTFALVTSYPQHAIARDFQYMSIFPRALGIKHEQLTSGWSGEAFLQSVDRSWAESGELKGVIDYNADKDIVGPLTIGLALSRELNATNPTDKDNTASAKTQRVVVIGDGDFLSNAYLGNQGNQNMGHNILNWLSHDDSLITIPASTAPDAQINLSELAGAITGLVFLILIPIGLLASGISIWLRRRKQ